MVAPPTPLPLTASVPLLARVCPVCDAAYAEHDLVSLAGCMELALGDSDFMLDDVDVEGPTYQDVFGRPTPP